MAPAKPQAKPKAAKPAKPVEAVPVKVNGVKPFLWFDGQAEEAARLYVSLIAGSKVVSANPMSVVFELAGQPFYALNGGPHYQLTPAYSMFVSVDTQEQVDTLWEALTADGGHPDRCGWLVDRYGLSWQVIPRRLEQLLGHRDPAVAQRATQAMLKMGKIDIAALDAAAGAGA
jgi:predicted 3-demethylubiquinone-9 3-methyltransferase (glyoxalase superfamily)